MIIDDNKYKLHSMKSLMFLNKRPFSDGGKIHHQGNTANRCAVIAYDHANNGQFIYSARPWNDQVSSYICQLPQQGLCEQTSVVALKQLLYTAE